jgi:hypothetical protein
LIFWEFPLAVIPGFKYDIFISYAYDDNPPIGNQPGWVEQFHQFLENWLGKRRGFKQLKIWRKNLVGNILFNEEIKEAISASALFFALHSRNYRQSDYCMKELAWFHQLNSERNRSLFVGNFHRIFNILLSNIHHSKWPEALGETSGFPLHDATSPEKPGEFTSPGDPNFEKQLRVVVDRVEETLNAFPQYPPEAKHSAGEVRPVKIFLSYVADSLQDFRERIAAEAAGAGAQVLEEIPPPPEKAAHAGALQQALARADLSLHLFDRWPGRKIVDQKKTSYPREQLAVALKNPLPKLIWVPGDLVLADIEDEAQRNFLNELANGAREAGSYEFVQVAQNSFIQLLREKISALQQPHTNGVAAHTCLVDTHQKDQRYAFKLAAFLTEQGITVEFNQESRDPTLSLTKFEQAVREVQHLIILAGTVGATWLKARIKKAFKIVSEQYEAEDTFTLKNIWVYLTPVSGGQVLLPEFPPLINISILDNSGSKTIDPKVLSPLLQQSSTGGSA